MKKFFVISIVFSLTFLLNNCEKEKDESPIFQPKEIREFLASPEWEKYGCLFASYGAYNTGTVEISENNETVQMFLPYYNYGGHEPVKVEELQIIKMEPGMLPDGDIYFINLIDFTKFDFESRTGNVSMYGTNYENFLHDEYLVADNIIQTNDFYPIPDKYLEDQIKGIGFFKCYRIMRDHYDSIDAIKFICDLDGLPCWLASTGACLYVMARQTK